MIIAKTNKLQELTRQYQQVRNKTLSICQPLEAEDCVVQPVVDVSPPKWHMGHTTWFFEQFLLDPYKKDYRCYHPRYAYVFNSYYEGAGERVNRSYRGNLTRPTVDEIRAYRTFVDEHMMDWLTNGEEKTDRMLYILEMGLQHEQQHQELLLYDIKYILGHNPLFPVYVSQQNLPAPDSQHSVTEKFLEFAGGTHSIGFEGEGFHFDNEEGRHTVYLEPFRILDRLVTAGEYLEFIEAGGYQDYRYWFQEAWHWVQQKQIEAPFYWFNIEGKWHHFTLHGLQPVDPYAPMTHVNLYEADAFAKWKGMRLPTEFEWEAACQQFQAQIPPEANFVDNNWNHPIPRQNQQYQFFGDVWEWTNSAYLAYPYYKAEESTLGEYNGKFMINQMVLRGGSCATSRNHIRPTYRNFFHPHLQWLFSGFRLAESIK